MTASISSTSDRDVLRSLAQVVPALPLFAFAPLFRRWHTRWGATDAEVAAPMPGDELSDGRSFTATRAITIEAPPEAIWPWIVQIGHGKAGFYSYDFFDNQSHPSADTILREFQEPNIGDWVPMAKKVNETTAFKVADFEPNAWLLWTKPRSTWAWKIVPVDAHRTRLITRIKDDYDWRGDLGGAAVSIVLMEFGDFPMIRKLLLNVKKRAEVQARQLSSAQGG